MSGLQIIESVEVVVDQQGKPAAVQLDIKTWESLLDWLEDVEDRALLQEKLPRLHIGPQKAGALRSSRGARRMARGGFGIRK